METLLVDRAEGLFLPLAELKALARKAEIKDAQVEARVADAVKVLAGMGAEVEPARSACRTTA